MPISPPDDRAQAAYEALLDRITKQAATATAPMVRDLAEAYAWLMYPNQSHGGGAHDK